MNFLKSFGPSFLRRNTITVFRRFFSHHHRNIAPESNQLRHQFEFGAMIREIKKCLLNLESHKRTHHLEINSIHQIGDFECKVTITPKKNEVKSANSEMSKFYSGLPKRDSIILKERMDKMKKKIDSLSETDYTIIEDSKCLGDVYDEALSRRLPGVY